MKLFLIKKGHFSQPRVQPRRKPWTQETKPLRGKPSATVLKKLLKKTKSKPSKGKGKSLKGKVPSKGKSVKGSRAKAQQTRSSEVEPTRRPVHEWGPNFLSAVDVDNFISNIEMEACEPEREKLVSELYYMN